MMSRRTFCTSALGHLALASPLVARPGSARIKAIDTHAHVFLHSLPMAADRRYTPDYDAPLAAYLSLLRANGIDRGVLVQPSFLGFDNSYMLAALRANRHILRGIAVIPYDVDEERLARLHDDGVAGVRLNLIGQPDPADTPLFDDFLRRLARRGWIVEIQVESRRLKTVAPPILDHGLRLVIDHFGRPDAGLGIADPGFVYLLDLSRTRRTWVKLSGAYRLAPGEAGERLAMQAAGALLDRFGPDRLMWGSDWPHTQFEKVGSYRAARESLDHWVPDRQSRQTILRQTPARLFGFDRPPHADPLPTKGNAS